MKSLPITIALLFGLCLAGRAQSTVSEIRLDRTAGSQKDWTINVTIDLSENMRDGLALELPGRVKIIPVSVQLNDQPVWLKQSEEAPALENTLTWFEDDSGRVVLRFTEDRLRAGDRLVVECATHMKESPESGTELSLKRLTRQGQSVTAAEEPFVSRTLPTIEETN